MSDLNALKDPVRQPLGDGAILWSWAGGISEDLSRRVLLVYRRLRDDAVLRDAGMVDVVPSYTEVALHFDRSRADRDILCQRGDVLVRQVPDASESALPGAESERVHSVPIRYDGEDLELVASHAGLDAETVVRLHRDRKYTVAMIGFRPHFPYLIGMDQRIATPRRNSPRTRISAGSVGIAGSQTGVYPVDSPGGWNIIGHSDPKALIPIRPGDAVVFVEDSHGEQDNGQL